MHCLINDLYCTGYTKEEIAETLGFNLSSEDIDSLDKGIMEPSLELCIKCAKIFGCTVEMLLSKNQIEHYAKTYGYSTTDLYYADIEFWEKLHSNPEVLKKKSYSTNEIMLLTYFSELDNTAQLIVLEEIDKFRKLIKK